MNISSIQDHGLSKDSRRPIIPDLLPDEIMEERICMALEVFEAQVMCLEESHSKQTPNLNEREWSLHQTDPEYILILPHSPVQFTLHYISCPLHDIILSPDKDQPSTSVSAAEVYKLIQVFFYHHSSNFIHPYTKPLILNIRKQLESP